MENTVWSFDLGKASIGEAVRNLDTNEFVHVASLLIPAEFASTKDAAQRRRAWRTRQAHKAREAWLDEVWSAANIPKIPEPLRKREVEKVDEEGNPVPKNKKGKWRLKHSADYRQEREFAPKLGEKTEDGAPTDESGILICYTSCLLRIKLLQGDKLEPWQIYKALHSAIQKRGYGRVPWAAREAKRSGKTEEEIEKDLQKKDPVYREAVEAWPKFKQEIHDARFHFPCYYDAWKMGLWSPDLPDTLKSRINCHANSTRKVRFDRTDVEKEIAELARKAAAQLPALAQMFARVQGEGWTLRDDKNNRVKIFPMIATDIGAFLVHGPAGEPLAEARNDFAAYLKFRTNQRIHPGSADDWMGATAQKTPRFDNRVINDCALISRLQVCGVAVRFDKNTGKPTADSLLASEVTFLMKLKNTLVAGMIGQRKLMPDEVRKIFAVVSAEAMAVQSGEKNATQKIVSRYTLTKSDWVKTKGIKELGLRPLKGYEEIKSPKTEGRSRFSRPALRLVRALILSGQKPSEFLRRLKDSEVALLDEIGMDMLDAEPASFSGFKQKGKEIRETSPPMGACQRSEIS